MVTLVFHDKSFGSLIVAPHNSTISLVKHVDRRSLSIPRWSTVPSRPFVHRSNRCNVICSENIIPRYVCNVEIVNSASFIAADACASLLVIYVSNLNVMNIIAYVFCYYWKYFLKIFLSIRGSGSSGARISFIYIELQFILKVQSTQISLLLIMLNIPPLKIR